MLLLSTAPCLFASHLAASAPLAEQPASVPLDVLKDRVSYDSCHPESQVFKDDCNHMVKHGHTSDDKQKELIQQFKENVGKIKQLREEINELNKQCLTEETTPLFEEIEALTQQLTQLTQQKEQIVPRFELWPYMPGLDFSQIMSYILSGYEISLGCGVSREVRNYLRHDSDVNALFFPQSLAFILDGSAFYRVLARIQAMKQKTNVWELFQIFLSYCEREIQPLVLNSYRLLLYRLAYRPEFNPIEDRFVYKDDKTLVIRCFVDKSSINGEANDPLYQTWPAIHEYWFNATPKLPIDDPKARMLFEIDADPDWNACDVIFQKVGNHWRLQSVCPSHEKIDESCFTAEKKDRLVLKLMELFGWNQSELDQFHQDFVTSCSNHFWAFLMHFDLISERVPNIEAVMQKIFPLYEQRLVGEGKEIQRMSKAGQKKHVEYSTKTVFDQMNTWMAPQGKRVGQGSFSWLTTCMIHSWTYNATEAHRLNYKLNRVSPKLVFFKQMKTAHQTNTRGGIKTIPTELTEKILAVKDALQKRQEELARKTATNQELEQKKNELTQLEENVHTLALTLAKELLANEEKLKNEAKANGWPRPPRSQVTAVALNKEEIIPWTSQNSGVVEICQIGDRAFYRIQTNNPADAIHLDLNTDELFLGRSNSIWKQVKIAGTNLYSKQTYPILDGDVFWTEKVDLK